jgi:hypothetical protein
MLSSGRQDRPAHVGEAPDEETGGVAHDVMVRFEEGHEPAPHFAEADEGVHLVDVAAHFLGERCKPVEQRVGAVFHRVAVARSLSSIA